MKKPKTRPHTNAQNNTQLTIWHIVLKSNECDKMDIPIIKADNNLVHSSPQTARRQMLPVCLLVEDP